MKMVLADYSVIERPTFYDKPQNTWTKEEARQAALIQEIHRATQAKIDQEQAALRTAHNTLPSE